MHRANFLKIDRGVQTLHISAHEMAPIGAFSILQKWPKIAKMTPDDLLTLIIWTDQEKLNKTLFWFSKNCYFWRFWPKRKNEFHGSHATYKLFIRARPDTTYDLFKNTRSYSTMSYWYEVVSGPLAHKRKVYAHFGF